MSRVVAIMLACALVHVGPPVVYLTLAIGAPAIAHDLFVYALGWTALLLGYDVLRMKRYD